MSPLTWSASGVQSLRDLTPGPPGAARRPGEGDKL